MRTKRSLLACAVALLGAAPAAAQAPPAAVPAPAAPAPAPPADLPKIAVLVLQVGDAAADLADNLTEVLIAEIARKGTFAIVGKEEFRSRLGMASEQGASACLEQPTCLGRVGTALGVSKVAAGTIGKRGADYAFNLNLIDIATATVESRVFKLVGGGVAGLINTLQSAALKIFEPKMKPGAVKISTPARGGARVYVDDAFIGTTPVRSGNLEAGTHRLRVEREGYATLRREVEVPAGDTLDVDLRLTELPPRRVWPAYVAWISLGAGALVGAGGIFLGVLSHEAPTGTTRAATLEDLDRKVKQARTANILFATAGALALTSAAVFIVYRRDIFTGAGPEKLAARPVSVPFGLAAAPLRGGAAVSGIIQF